jgi:hypothetical protein
VPVSGTRGAATAIDARSEEREPANA